MDKLDKLEKKIIKKSILKIIKILNTIHTFHPLTFQFMEICSLIKSDEVPQEILEEFLKFLGKKSAEVFMIHQISIKKYDMLRTSTDKRGKIFYTMHPMVLEVMKSTDTEILKCTGNKWENLLIISKILQNSVKNCEDSENNDILKHAQFFLLNLIKYTGDTGGTEELGIENFLKLNDEIDTLMTTILAKSLESIQEIELIFENYVNVVQVIVKDPNDIFKLYSRMAEVFYANKNWSQCVHYYEKALAKEVELYGANHIQSTSTLKSLGYTLYELGEKKTSLAFHEKSLKLQKYFFGENSKFYVEQLTELGEHYFVKNVFISVHYFNRVAVLERAYFQGPTEYTKKKIISCNQRMIQ